MVVTLVGFKIDTAFGFNKLPRIRPKILPLSHYFGVDKIPSFPLSTCFQPLPLLRTPRVRHYTTSFHSLLILKPKLPLQHRKLFLPAIFANSQLPDGVFDIGELLVVRR